MEHFKYPTEKSIEKLCEDLNLPKPDKYSQNWEHEVMIEYNCINEFVKYYQSASLDDETKFTLMILIINSLNDVLGIRERLSNSLWNKVSNILVDDNKIHMNTIIYWALEDEEEEEYIFPITPYIRAVLFKI